MKKAFTLIELLVVIAIIAIVATSIMSAVERLKTRSPEIQGPSYVAPRVSGAIESLQELKSQYEVAGPDRKESLKAQFLIEYNLIKVSDIPEPLKEFRKQLEIVK
jgi:prepilin-type N-terminal cleavage/methylation domain-containing protein